jgi:hypothetical protein
LWPITLENPPWKNPGYDTGKCTPLLPLQTPMKKFTRKAYQQLLGEGANILLVQILMLINALEGNLPLFFFLAHVLSTIQ